jgi:arylsulfatase A-like enzyme
VWDESSKTAHWRNRKNPEQSFFSVFNLMTTHESQVWMRANEPLLVDPKNVTVPPYYPDVPEVRLDIARHLSNVMVMDQQAGEILRQLEEDGLADNTIVFFYSDHGDGLPFAKREIYDRGIRVPMIIRFGKNWKSLSPLPEGKVDDQLISLVDLAPTMLSITGYEVPNHLQGHAFLGPKKTSPRKHIFAARDRMDSEYDRVRCIRDSRFMYLRNYLPDRPYYQNIKYRLQQSMMPIILKMKDEGKLNDEQMHWFKLTKPEEELYDCDADPYQFNNLADDPRYKKKLEELRKAFDQWMNDVGDLSEIPESKMVQQWWNGRNQAPVTAMPKADQDSDAIKLTTATRGASIGYRLRQNDSWKVYTEPVRITGTDTLQAVAQRIGYSRSDTISILLKK